MTDTTSARTSRAHLEADLARVQQLVPYLRAQACEPNDDDWLRCRDLIDHPSLLAETVRRTGAGRGTDDPQVAASLFAQAYAFRVCGVTLASWTLARRVPDPAADTLAIQIARHRPNAVAFLAPNVAALATDPAPSHATCPNEDALLSWLHYGIAQHLHAFFATLRSIIDIGERLLWGNTAAACAAAFRAVESAAERPQVIRADGAAFFDQAPPQLHGLGSFITITNNATEGWFYERTTCCLYAKVPGATRCDDCSLSPPDERRAIFAATLTGH